MVVTDAESAQVRSERGGVARRRQFALGAAAAVVATMVLGAGVFVGKATSPDAEVALPTPTVAPDPTGTKLATFTDPVTKASMTVKVVPAAGWVRTNMSISGIPEGEKCRIFVVAKDGSRQEAGSWVVSKKGAAEGTAYSGSKWAVRGITQCWQAELRPYNVRVTCICPSEVQTNFGGRGGRNNPNKLYATDIAATILAGLALPQRVLWTELAIFATNPWKED